MQTKIALLGYGKLGRQLYSMLTNQFSKCEFKIFDDLYKETNNANTILSFTKYLDWAFRENQFYVALGYHHLRKKNEIIKELLSLGRKLPFFLHPSGYQDPTVTFGSGSIIFPMSNIDQNTKIGNGCLLHNSVVVSHDCVVGDCSYLSPGCVIAGNVKVGAEVFLGAGVTVANGIKIGDRAKVGIGTVVTMDIQPDTSVIGNPMRFLEKPLKLS